MSKFPKVLAPALSGVGAVLTGAYFLADQLIVDIPAPLRGVFVGAAQAQEAAATTAADVAMSREGGFGLGRMALPEEVAAWNTDVRPDGQGLPVGSGDVWTGEEVYIENCTACHGDFGEGVGRWPVLAGGEGTLTAADPNKTVGSYWPYLSTVYDYVGRAMPFGHAQSLTADEKYALTAYVLYLNDIVDDDFELSQENFASFEMPNAANFIDDDRSTTEIPQFSAEPCMSACKDSVEITMHASVLDVTPEETAAKAEAAQAEAATELAAEAAPDPDADPALIAAGESAFRQCKSCHQVGEGAANRSGPQLNGVLGRVIGSADGFRYSNAFTDANAAGEVWSNDNMAAFLADPRGAMSGTKMTFRGVRDERDIAALIAYLDSFSGP